MERLRSGHRVPDVRCGWGDWDTDRAPPPPTCFVERFRFGSKGKRKPPWGVKQGPVASLS